MSQKLLVSWQYSFHSQGSESSQVFTSHHSSPLWEPPKLCCEWRCGPSLRGLTTYKRLNARVSFGWLKLQWVESITTLPTLVSGSHRPVPTSIVSGTALHGFYKGFLSRNSLITIYVVYVTVGAGDTPIRLNPAKSVQCHVHTYPEVRTCRLSTFSAFSCVVRVRSADLPHGTIKSFGDG